MLTPIIHTSIDLHVEVIPVNYNELSEKKKGEKSSEIRKRVIAAREIQQQRFKEINNVHCNAQMTTKMVNKYCQLNDECNERLKMAMQKLGLSARAFDRILKVSRTIADLDNSENIEIQHLSEAINFRSLDRENWGK